MSTRRHMPADDFDGDEEARAAAPAPALPTSLPRRVRSRRVLGADRSVKDELIVECPVMEAWPAFRECLACARFRGYSFAPGDAGFVVSCALEGEATAKAPGPHGGCAATTPVGAIMSDPVCVRQDASLDELVLLFVEWKIGGVPVVDAEGRVVGMVSKTDIVEARAGEMPLDGLTARDLMTPEPVTVSEETTIAAAAGVMSERRIHRAPVVARSGKVVGIITSLDLARWIASSREAAGRTP